MPLADSCKRRTDPASARRAGCVAMQPPALRPCAIVPWIWPLASCCGRAPRSSPLLCERHLPFANYLSSGRSARRRQDSRRDLRRPMRQQMPTNVAALGHLCGGLSFSFIERDTQSVGRTTPTPNRRTRSDVDSNLRVRLTPIMSEWWPSIARGYEATTRAHAQNNRRSHSGTASGLCSGALVVTGLTPACKSVD